MFENDKQYVFKRILFIDDMKRIFPVETLVHTSWAHNIDDNIVYPLDDTEGYCGDYYVCREWCEEVDVIGE